MNVIGGITATLPNGSAKSGDLRGGFGSSVACWLNDGGGTSRALADSCFSMSSFSTPGRTPPWLPRPGLPGRALGVCVPPGAVQGPLMDRRRRDRKARPGGPPNLCLLTWTERGRILAQREANGRGANMGQNLKKCLLVGSLAGLVAAMLAFGMCFWASLWPAATDASLTWSFRPWWRLSNWVLAGAAFMSIGLSFGILAIIRPDIRRKKSAQKSPPPDPARIEGQIAEEDLLEIFDQADEEINRPPESPDSPAPMPAVPPKPLSGLQAEAKLDDE